MKKIYLFLFSLIVCISTLQAAVSFNPDLRYRLVCKQVGQGCLALGSRHHAPALLFHTSDASVPEDGWWYIAASANGYTLRNAATQQYIVRDEERITTVKKGLALSESFQGTATEWNIEGFGTHFVIKSVKDPEQWFNLRCDGSGLMGTYPGTGSNNELFDIFDEMGRKVLPEGGDIVPPVVSGDFAQAFKTLRINQKDLVYDNEHQCYYFPLPDSVRQGYDFHMDLSYQLKDPTTQYKVTLDPAFEKDSKGGYILSTPDCSKGYVMSLQNGKGQDISQSTLYFTYLPIVEINLPDCNSSVYSMGALRVSDGNRTGCDTLYHANFKYRGNTSLRYAKKSFNIKLKDDYGNAMDRSFFGLRSDNRWILDAMMIDKSCLRNRVAMELWNDFATPPYYADREPKARTGTRGKFVEVFWNGKYHGLFCMTERIDRKQLDLKKFVPRSQSLRGQDEVHGLLYKGKEWSYETFMGHYSDHEDLPGTSPGSYTNEPGNDRWCNYEIKYPDYKTEAVEWKPLYDAVNFVATSSQVTFDRELNKYFDFPVLLDYYLFMDVLLATDNHGKNVFFFAYDNATARDRKLSLAPWDLDAILGINWESRTDWTTPDWDLDEYIRTYEHGQNTIFIKLRQSSQIKWKDLLAIRYAQLRPTFFNPDSLIKRVDDYATLFAASGADLREQDKWQGWHSDLQEGAEYIKNWLQTRIETLDEKYGFDPVISSVNSSTAENYLKITGGQGYISIVSGKAQRLRIYHITGQLVREVNVAEGVNQIDQIPSGIYIVGNRKIIVR